ncbi:MULTISPECIES: hypothetical protein [unclassified Janthinobacterium]|uniref:hypothetical protein n=1 Tax=unclassified Janthinobacterium TaxID=2610881 RepID=UPI00034762F7|nr:MULTISPECIES: hypothetical protein [unclassified Janthinobacterium]MEC5160288.1 hypothetical protein [Janthinobacterium sp. CG_S6]
MTAPRLRARLSLSLSLALACGAAQAASAPLGRLFATPAERAQLDARRDGHAGAGAPAAAPAPPAAAVESAPAPAPAPTTLDGVVRRSGGKSTVWLNQMPQREADDRLGADPAAAALSLQLPSGQTVILKPGQSYNPTEGTVRESHAQ